MGRNHWFQKLVVIVLILALTGGMGVLFATRAAKRSVNPFLDRDPESSRMYQEEAASLSVDSPDFPPAENSTSLPPEEDPPEEEPELHAASVSVRTAAARVRNAFFIFFLLFIID